MDTQYHNALILGKAYGMQHSRRLAQRAGLLPISRWTDKAMALDELITLMERFVSGDAISVADANRLEVLLRESASELPALEDLADELAQYRPEGGDYLFDFKWMKPRVAHDLAALRARLSP